jgi:2'-phosphotransferase
VAIHGTTLSAWEKIKSDGLYRMRRAHIHMSPGIVGVDDGVKSGMRTSSTVHIYIDTAKAMSRGIKFYKSDNGVILSDGIDGGYIPIDCFSKVVYVPSGETLYMP